MEITAQSNPLAVFDSWLKEARSNAQIREPTAMALATLAPGGVIHNRIVLCKQWDENGLVFYTNYHSQKGHELGAHAAAGAVFYWDPLHRQVRVSGPVEKISAEDSRAYWQSRARESQLSQFVSKQSETLGSRAELEKLWAAAEAEYAGREIPCPPHWGGYVLHPTSVEFWVGRPGRLHDRFQFEKQMTALSGQGQKAWTFRRLYP